MYCPRQFGPLSLFRITGHLHPQVQGKRAGPDRATAVLGYLEISPNGAFILISNSWSQLRSLRLRDFCSASGFMGWAALKPSKARFG